MSLIIVILYSPLQSRHAAGYLASAPPREYTRINTTNKRRDVHDATRRDSTTRHGVVRSSATGQTATGKSARVTTAPPSSLHLLPPCLFSRTQASTAPAHHRAITTTDDRSRRAPFVRAADDDNRRGRRRALSLTEDADDRLRSVPLRHVRRLRATRVSLFLFLLRFPSSSLPFSLLFPSLSISLAFVPLLSEREVYEIGRAHV